MKAAPQTHILQAVLLIGLLFLPACGNTPDTAIPPTETQKAVEPTEEIQEIAVDTPTPTPEPHTPTSPPTITSTPAPIFEYSKETVSFMTEDGYELEGTLFLSEGDLAVVFAHMAGGDNDQRNWIPFAKEAAQRGFNALTFNFRCYGNSGCGGSDSGAILLSRDIGAAVDFLRGKGLDTFVCVGASMGGRGCVNAAFDEELDGLVIVAGTGSSHPDRQNLADFISPEMPKLFIVGENDHIADRTQVMIELYESAPEPKTLITYPSQSHGTELFGSKYGQDMKEAILGFLGEIQAANPSE